MKTQTEVHTCKTEYGIKTYATREAYCDACEQEAYEQDQLEAQLGEIEAEFIMSWVNGGGSPSDARLAFKQMQKREEMEEAERKFNEKVSRWESEELARVEKNLQKRGVIY